MTKQNLEALVVIDEQGQLKRVVEREQILSKMMLAFSRLGFAHSQTTPAQQAAAPNRLQLRSFLSTLPVAAELNRSRAKKSLASLAG